MAVNSLPVKIFLFSNEGYASIRMTQRNYFDGAYLGCDTRTGLGFPDWEQLFTAYGIPVLTLDETGLASPEASASMFELGRTGRVHRAHRPGADLLPEDHLAASPRLGSMESSPLHLMSPDLPDMSPDESCRHLRPERRRSRDR